MFNSRDRKKCERLLDKYYANYRFHSELYRDLIRKYLVPGQRILDAGCGHYLKFSKELSSIADVVGVDLFGRCANRGLVERVTTQCAHGTNAPMV